MKSIPLMAIVVLFLPLVFSLTHAAPLTNEKMNQLENQFDQSSFALGQLIVSFDGSVTLDEAQAIIEQHGLVIKSGQKCYTEGYGGPGQEPVEIQKCEDSVEWNESLNVALVSVPEGMEKEWAVKLIAEEKITWIEPNYIAYASGDEDTVPVVSNPGITNKPGRGEPPAESSPYYWSWALANEPYKSGVPIVGAVIVIFLAVGAWVVLKKK